MTKPMNKVLKAQFFVDDLSDDQKAVITDINSYIKQGLSEKAHSIAVIEGAAGTGKSVVLMELVRQYMTDKRYKTALVVNHPELTKPIVKWAQPSLIWTSAPFAGQHR